MRISPNRASDDLTRETNTRQARHTGWYFPEGTIARFGQPTNLAMNPRIVVPGHGEIGDGAILVTVRRYLEQIAARVTALSDDGMAVDAMVDLITSEMTAAHPDWDAPEWVGFVVRYHADHR